MPPNFEGVAVEVFWNIGEKQNIMGLDSLGIRQVDQTLERRWVSNITTISYRARYLSLLTWVIAEFYSRSLVGGPGAQELQIDLNGLLKTIKRLEFVVVAATLLPQDEAANTSRLIGPELFQDDVTTLMADGHATLPESTNSSMLGIYFMPCRGFGLLDETSDRAAVRVMPRGTEVHAAMRHALGQSVVAERIFSGGTVSRVELEHEVDHFSLNGLGTSGEERALLQSAMLTPFGTGGDVDAIYQRFLGTTKWAFLGISERPSSSTDLITRAYVDAPNAGTGQVVEIAWGEYELHRRVHHALELLFSCLVAELNERDQATVDSVVAQWCASADLPQKVRATAQWGDEPFSMTFAELTDGLAPQFLTARLSRAEARSLAPRPRALYALAMLACDRRHSASMRRSDAWPLRQHALDRTFEILDQEEQSPIQATTARLLSEVIVQAHWANTLRKMSQGGKCSLRFTLDGQRLRATGVGINAGFSADRLGNVLGVWADLGTLRRVDTGRFRMTALGTQILQRLEA